MLKPPVQEYKGVLALVFANFIWSGTFPATALAIHQMTPIFLSLVRLTIGALLLTPLLFYHSGSWDSFVLRWQPITLALGLGILGFTAPMVLEIQGLALTTPALTAIFIALEPVFTVLMSALWLHESLPKLRWLAVVIAVVGAWFTAGLPRPGNTGHWTGDVLLFCAVLCYATYNVTSKYLLHWMSPEAAAAGTLWGGMVGTLPL
ncbi:EamA family transporter, partial [Alicyclobacillaceae bacterium I2511]